MSIPHIIGWCHTPFGKLDALDAEALFRDAALQAIASAGLDAADVTLIDSLTAQKRLAQAGFGLALVPESSVRDELYQPSEPMTLM